MSEVSTPPIYCGVDIGGTSTRIGLFQTLDTPAFTLVARFLTHANYDEQMQQVIAAIEGSGVRNLAGIGVSIGGRIAQDGRSVIFAPNMLTYIGRPFAQDLIDRFACPVRLAHDTVCGLLGEKQFGPIREVDRCAYLTISTGTGAAFQLRKGSSALSVSIEFGHQILDGNTLVCLCGQTGCLETFTGGRQLELRLGRRVEQITDTAFWETFSDKLALGLVNLAQLTKVEEVAVSGAIALNTPFLLPRVQQKVDAMLVGARLRLSRAFLQENAPLVGAVTLLHVPEDTILH
jgi:glucokinase